MPANGEPYIWHLQRFLRGLIFSPSVESSVLFGFLWLAS